MEKFDSSRSQTNDKLNGNTDKSNIVQSDGVSQILKPATKTKLEIQKETNNAQIVVKNPTRNELKAKDWIYLILSLAYAISPIDLSGADVPIVGWIDDALLLSSAGLNFFQKVFHIQNELIDKIFKVLKWGFLISAILLALIILLLATILVKLMN